MTHNRTIEFHDNDLLPLLFGEHNANLGYLEKKLGIHIADRGNHITLSGQDESVRAAEKILQGLWERLEKKQDVGRAEIDAALRFIHDKQEKPHREKDARMDENGLVIKTRKKTIVPRSPNQAAYMRSILNNEMIFGLGPAGTGKTYLAVAVGVSLFLEGKVERLIFCRPAVEAGERLGFLPGDMKEKIDPYLRPIYDALHDMMDTDFMVRKMTEGDIEIAPLAFMRGRTLSNAFVILDEAQNTTCTQMKMFLTRMGEASRMVITGDITQTDLPVGIKSGLRDATELLDGVEGIEFMRFNKDDVIRHPLVSKIVNAYDTQNKTQ